MTLWASPFDLTMLGERVDSPVPVVSSVLKFARSQVAPLVFQHEMHCHFEWKKLSNGLPIETLFASVEAGNPDQLQTLSLALFL